MHGLYRISSPSAELVEEFALDIIALGEKYNIEIHEGDEDSTCAEWARRQLQKGDFQAFLTSLNEEVIKKGEATLGEDILIDYLKQSDPKQELIIIDPHLFPTNPAATYLALLTRVIGSVVAAVNTVHIITKSNYNQNLFATLRSSLRSQSSNTVVKITISDDFHDRFWICDKTHGIIVGTSLNGLGIRYSVIQKLDDLDTQDIVNSLRTEGLI